MDNLFGQTLRTLRRKKGLSQSVLADRSGIALRTIINWESGATRPRAPELQAVLKALETTALESAEMVNLLTTSRGLRLSKEVFAAQSGDIVRETVPGIGDLLRAMRTRKQMTQRELADQLSVRRHAVLRWENGQNVLAAEHLERLCDLLEASPEERAALQQRRLTLPSWEDHDWTKVTVEEAAQIWQNLHRGHRPTEAGYRPPPSGFELRVLALKRYLHVHLVPDIEVRRLLAQIETDYGVWLFLEDRPKEARACVQRALALMEGDRRPQDFWASALNLAAAVACQGRGGANASLRFLEDILPRLPMGAVRTQQLCNMAFCKMEVGQGGEAPVYLDQARRSMDRPGGPSEWELFYFDVNRERMKFLSGEADKLPDRLLERCFNDLQRTILGLLWTRMALHCGEKAEASYHLAIARSVEAHDIPARVQRAITDLTLQI